MPARLMATMCLAACLTGCVTPGAMDIPDPQRSSKTSLRVSAAKIMPLQPAQAMVEWTVGDSSRTVSYQFEQLGNLWLSTVEKFRRVELQPQPDGSIAIVAEEDLTESVRVEYDPPLLMLPATLSGGNSVEGQSKVTVRNLSDGTITQTGQASYRIELVEAKPNGQPPTDGPVYVVESHRRLDLNLVQALVTTRESYAPGRGWIGETVTYITRPLGLFETRKTRTLRVIHWNR